MLQSFGATLETSEYADGYLNIILVGSVFQVDSPESFWTSRDLDFDAHFRPVFSSNRGIFRDHQWKKLNISTVSRH